MLATAKDKEQRHLARRLSRFRWTQFRKVLVGRVKDHQAFFEQLQRCDENEPGFLYPVAKLVPVDRVFTFNVENLPTVLKSVMADYADVILAVEIVGDECGVGALTRAPRS